MTQHKIPLILLSILLLLDLSSAVSFECDKTATEVEKTICSDKVLSALDTFLALAYQQALSRSSDKNRLKASQHHWLTSERNTCKDDERCLHSAYYVRILTLSDTGKNTTLSGSYTRYYHNRPSFHTSDIDILELGDHQIYLNGIATWYPSKEQAAKGVIHTGEINGISPIIDNRAVLHGTYGGSLLITFEKNGVVVSESKNGGDWGANVTFDGYYRKIR